MANTCLTCEYFLVVDDTEKDGVCINNLHGLEDVSIYDSCSEYKDVKEERHNGDAMVD